MIYSSSLIPATMISAVIFTATPIASNIRSLAIENMGAQQHDVIMRESDEITVDFSMEFRQYLQAFDSVKIDEYMQDNKIKIVQRVGAGASAAVLTLAILSVSNIIHYAIWLPAIIALFGILAAGGSYLNELEDGK